MRPSRAILAKALAWTILAGLAVAGTAAAQFYDPVVASLRLGSDVPRSPRLLGMGGLSLVVPDRANRIALWDFAASPLGLGDVDSASTLDVRPGTGSVDAVQSPFPRTGVPLSQILAGRRAGLPFEVFHRDAEGNAAGAVVNLATVRSDRPYGPDTELRRIVQLPAVMPVMTGPFRYWGKGRLRYAARLLFGRELLDDTYRSRVVNPSGSFVSLDGTTRTPPDLMRPVEYDVRTMGYGIAFSYPLAGHTTLALGGDMRRDRIAGSDDLARSQSQLTESRPTNTGQATLIGRLGPALEYGLDGRLWAANSDQLWTFSTSAGSGVTPLNGRGTYLKRLARGTAFQSRVRWTGGKLELGGSAWTRWSRVKQSPPRVDDSRSFNSFLRLIYARTTADSLVLPDSVVGNVIQDHSMGYGLGASWALARGRIGAEWHWSREANDQTVGGGGPRVVGWALRAGLERACTQTISGRLGVGLGRLDENTMTALDEWNTRSVSFGFGVRPVASWDFDLGYAFEWGQSAFGDPAQRRDTRQQLSSQVHWRF